MISAWVNWWENGRMGELVGETWKNLSSIMSDDAKRNFVECFCFMPNGSQNIFILPRVLVGFDSTD